jgi:hypothetical protein
MLQDFKTQIEPLNDKLGDALGIRKIVVTQEYDIQPEDGPQYDLIVLVRRPNATATELIAEGLDNKPF